MTLTETLPAITSFSTIFQTVAVDADTVTQTSIEVDHMIIYLFGLSQLFNN